MVDWDKFEYTPNMKCDWCLNNTNYLNGVYEILLWSRVFKKHICILNPNRKIKDLKQTNKCCSIL